jgi:hypothetical protein
VRQLAAAFLPSQSKKSRLEGGSELPHSKVLQYRDPGLIIFWNAAIMLNSYELWQGFLQEWLETNRAVHPPF